MTLKRFFKGPFIWIVGIFIFFMIGSQLVSSANAPTRVDTWEAISAIKTGKVQEALVRDRDQILLLTKRPTSIADILSYDDPRPRTTATLSEASFIATKKKSLEIFQREVRK